MEELDNILDSVAHKNRIKDSPCHLYRFLNGDDTDYSYIDESTAIATLMESVGAQHHQYTSLSPLPPAEITLSSAFTSATDEKRKNF